MVGPFLIFTLIFGPTAVIKAATIPKLDETKLLPQLDIKRLEPLLGALPSSPLPFSRRDNIFELNRKRCEQCKAMPICKDLSRCKVCQRICDDVEAQSNSTPPSSPIPNPTIPQEIPNKIPDLKSRFFPSTPMDNDVLGATNPVTDIMPAGDPRFYTVSEIAPGPLFKLMARLFDIKDHSKVEKFLLLAQLKNDGLSHGPMIVDLTKSFSPDGKTEPMIFQPDQELGGRKIDVANQLERDLDSAIKNKKKELSKPHLSRDEINGIVKEIMRRFNGRDQPALAEPQKPIITQPEATISDTQPTLAEAQPTITEPVSRFADVTEDPVASISASEPETLNVSTEVKERPNSDNLRTNYDSSEENGGSSSSSSSSSGSEEQYSRPYGSYNRVASAKSGDQSDNDKVKKHPKLERLKDVAGIVTNAAEEIEKMLDKNQRAAPSKNVVGEKKPALSTDKEGTPQSSSAFAEDSVKTVDFAKPPSNEEESNSVGIEDEDESGSPTVQARGEFPQGSTDLQLVPSIRQLPSFGSLIPASATGVADGSGTLVPGAAMNSDNLRKMLFIGKDISLPLQMYQGQDGALQLTVDMDRLCDCKNQTCTKKHVSSEESSQEISSPEASDSPSSVPALTPSDSDFKKKITKRSAQFDLDNKIRDDDNDDYEFTKLKTKLKKLDKKVKKHEEKAKSLARQSEEMILSKLDINDKTVQKTVQLINSILELVKTAAVSQTRQSHSKQN